MHAAYYRPGGVYRDLPDAMPQYQRVEDRATRRRSSELNENRQGSLLDFIEDFTQALPEARRRVRDAAHRQPHLEAAHRRHRRGLARARARPRLHRPDAARLGHRLGPAQEAAVRGLRPRWTSTSRSACNGDCYDRYLVRVEEMRQSNRIIKQCVDWLRANPGPVMTDNHKVAPPSRVEMKDEHGRADPPLQALHRRLSACPKARRTPRSSTRRASSASTSCRDGANKPYRLKIRAPGFPHLAALDEMVARPHDRRRRWR